MNLLHVSDEISLGQHLRHIRESRRLSRRVVAELAKIDPATIVGLEAGRGTVTSLFAIANVLALRICGRPADQPLGSWLRSERQARGWSQERSVRETGLSKPTLIALERGRGQLSSLVRLLRGFGIEATITETDVVRVRPNYEVLHADAFTAITEFADGEFDALVTDPPYGLRYYSERQIRELLADWTTGSGKRVVDGVGFMARDWDLLVPPEFWRAALRALKPGGHLAVYAAPRVADLTVLSLRLAGADIRHTVAIGHSGSMTRGQDAAIMMARERLRSAGELPPAENNDYSGAGASAPRRRARSRALTEKLDQMIADDPELSELRGTGLGLRPSHDIIIIGRKPPVGSTLANVVRHGVGGLRTSDASFVRGAKALHPGDFIDDLDMVPSMMPGARASKIEKNAHLPPGLTNDHPSVKPLRVLCWLVRLLSRPGARILDPFAGSGSTGVAAVLEGRHFVGIELEEQFARLARARLRGWASTFMDEDKAVVTGREQVNIDPATVV